MADSELVHSVGPERTLEQRDLEVMRPSKANAPRQRQAPAAKPVVDRERHCVRCGYRTSNVDDFANHVAGELWQARIEIAGNDADDLEIHVSGKRRPQLDNLPVALSAFLAWRQSLGDEECRLAQAERQRLRKRGLPVPEEVHQRAMEYYRRLQIKNKGLSAADRRAQWLLARQERDRRIKEDQAYRLRLLPVERRRELRLAQGLTARQVREKLGVCRASVSAWEAGESVPRGELFLRYAELLGVEVPEPVMHWEPGIGKRSRRR